MPFDLEDSFVVLDDKKIATSKNIETGISYFDDRIALRGELAFGLCKRSQEKRISLADNGIKVPIIIDSIICFAEYDTNDEIYFNLYRQVDNQLVKIARQRYTSVEMPLDFPDAIVYPDMVIGALPTRADSVITIVAKPVKVLFRATPEGL